MSMPAYEEYPRRLAIQHRAQLPTPSSSTDMFLAAILEEMQMQGRQIAELQEEISQARTDLALIRAATPPVSLPVSLDAAEPDHSIAPMAPAVPESAPERLVSRRRGNHRR